MPAPPAALALPGAMAAAKHIAVHAAAYVDVTTFTSATFAAVLAQWIWKRLPHWIKEDISFRNLLRNKDEVSREELSHLGSIVDKLQSVAESAQVDAVPQVHAAVLAYIQLSGQLKLEQIQEKTNLDVTLTRDSMYRNAGTDFPLEKLRSVELQEALTLATWAYYEDTQLVTKNLDELDYTLLTHSLSSRPGNVAYFVAVSPERKQLVVGVRGTSTLEDILTDCCGRPVPLEEDEDDSIRIEVQAAVPNTVLVEDGDVEIVSGHERILLENSDDEGDNYVRCHEGILISSRRMVDQLEPLIGDLIRNCGYRLVLCGHSLGAGAAALAALMLRSRFPELTDQPGRVQVYAFAPPPILDHDSAIAAASFCTSVVNNADMIPRCGLSNLAVLLECLRRIHERLVEEGMNPTGPRSTAAFLQKLSQGISGDLLMTASELNETIREAHENVELRNPAHLYIPGRVLLVYNPWIGNDDEDDSTTDPESISWMCTETDGTADVFRTLEVDGPRLFTDHVTSSYFEALAMDYSF